MSGMLRLLALLLLVCAAAAGCDDGQGPPAFIDMAVVGDMGADAATP